MADDAHPRPVSGVARLKLWFFGVLTALPPAALAGWLASLVVTPIASRSADIGFPRIEASMFWAAALVPLALMAIGVPLAYWFAGSLGARAFDAVPAGSTRTHRRIVDSIQRATPFGHALPRPHVIDAPWVGAVALWQPRPPGVLALTTGSGRLTEAELDALVESAIISAHADSRVARVRQAMTSPLAGAYNAAREIRWGSHRGRAMVLLLAAPALVSLPPGIEPSALLIAIPLLMGAAGIGLFVVFALGGLWARVVVRVADHALGPATRTMDGSPGTISPSAGLAPALEPDGAPQPPGMLGPLVHQGADIAASPLRPGRFKRRVASPR